ncbi:hypothetical protein HYH03_016231 [Edaphochlamys debaryana]|uniref:type I protein arginine methyltransferase n=1 Tax=Edaphochlamys debaryana TaxID=47281 RepID=A0A835XJ36_9CHLO|nr:hypothetical protein HYH03_016231 [Edaphochlamys debaryana]|eukprot:KAG2485028.1 hypothetical protein HYH03_016231 [Edaphochlamys debaryana]
MFVQKINPLTGEADWVLVNDPGLGDEDDASADLVATSSYLDMLTDSRRNAAYAAALRRVIPAKQRAATAAAAATPASGAAAPAAEGSAAAAVATAQGVRVLDIGTGTGLLAMLAARALGVQTAAPVEGAAAAAEGGKEGGERGQEGAGKAPTAPLDAPVVACEVFPPMQTLARRVIASNGLAGAIRLVDKRSDEIKLQTAAATAAPAGDSTAGRQAAARAKLAAAAAGGAANLEPDMSEKVDVIVTEIFDSELLGEGMVPTMRHAVQHLLKEGGAVIPATSRLYGQLLQCPLMANMTGLRSAADGSAATPWSGPDGAAAAANHVLGTLAAMDAAAREAFYKGDELYEVREMHVDLLTSSSAPASSSSPAASAPAPGSGSPLLVPLSEPFPVFDFDWAAPPPASGRKATIQVPVTADGTAHAVLLWWQLGMTKEGPAEAAESGSGSGEGPALLLSTAPEWVQGRPEAGGDGGPLGGFEQRWRDHWKQCWAQLTPEAPALRAGDSVSLRFEHDDLNVRTRMLGAHLASTPTSTSTSTPAAGPASTPTPASSQVQAGAAGEAGAYAGPHAGPHGAHPTAHAKEVLAALRAEAAQSARLMPLLNCLAPQALLQLGDRPRLASFGRALQAALDSAASASSSPSPSAAPGAEVVVVDGSLALGLLAATHPGVASVTLLQESSMAAGEWLTAAAERLGVASKIRSVRAEAYFKRLAARPSAAAATASAPAASGATATATAGSAEASTSGAVATAVAAPVAAAGPVPLVLAAEPYYSEFEQLVPWAHLKFWRDFDVIRDATAGKAKGAKGAGAKGGAAAAGAAGGAQGPRPVACFPSGARLMAAAASLPELWRTRCALDNIEGLDLSTANAVLGVVGGEDEPGAEGGSKEGAEPSGKDKGQGQGKSKGGNASGSGDDDEDVWGDDDGSGSDDSAGGGGKGAARQPLPVLPYSIWQAGGGYEELSERSKLLRLDCSSHLDDVEGGAVLTAVRPGVCHAVVLWMDYDLSPPSGSGRSELSVTTGPLPNGGPTAAVQGVYLLRKPYEVKPGSRIHVEANFDGLDADIAVDVMLLP